ncbi:MAG TPA: CYTH and CHAD domain-containing protein [Actinocrinis sp.]|uniref:CYTH and CHAD domain-containing protein n=1 Tax=Actinocrinis sp. TaxID=1920516 RepID=UPI002DDD10A1|nr:CYTH and CHAD domain-containing protein [Actinocrinis sp.]HEV3170459.1 CYTH and CHAD domain-containing protein [Actinocrinis sp.]
MATKMQETEWKYQAPPDTALPDLTGLPRVAAQSEPEEQTLDAVYHDTAGLDLAHAGITLRQRSGGEDAGWHLKLPQRPGVRTELRLPAGRELPAEFRELLTATRRGRPLQPVAHITTKRRLSRLRDQAGADLAEVVVDTVTAETFGDTTTLIRWDEVEVELADGVPGARRLLKAADQRLRRDGLHRSHYTSKLEQALGRRLTPAEAEPPADPQSAGDVLRAYLAVHLEKLTSADLRVRGDEADAVHDMRVTARRLRSALQAFRPLFRRGDITGLINELRWLGEVLGHARDDEVLRGHLSATLSQVPAELVLGPVQARVTGFYAPREAASRKRLLKALGSERYLALLTRLDALVADPPLTADAERLAGEALPPLVWRSFRRARRRIRRATEVAPGPQRDHALHEARKAAKRARYAAEAVEPAVGKNARRSAKGLKRLQSALGEHQDTVIARQALTQLAVRAHADHETTFTYGLVHGYQAAQAARAQHAARRAWRRVNRKKRTAWMQ